ncbi:MAG: S-layer homology domain-containing protein [Candidatus Gracilibacteria bacterium]
MPYKKPLFVAIILSTIILIVSLLFIYADTSAEFSDMSSGSPFFDAVNYVESQEIVIGYADDTYKPDNPINRAEFTKIVISATFTENEISTCTPNKTFYDVKSSDWFYKYVCTASNNAIVSGYSDGTFKPANNINFAEASKIIVNAFGYKTSEKEIWYQSFVEELEGANAIPSTIRSVSKNITRGEMAEMIYRLEENITDKSSMSFFSEDAEDIKTTTFLKSYRIKDTADSFEIIQTSDGGYAITGRTLTPSELCGYSMFWIKADKNGNKTWSRLFHNCSSEGFAITQLTDGNYLVAGDVSGEFRTDEEQSELEGQGDNLVIKLDGNGNQIWTRTVSQQSIDAPSKLAPTEDGGFVMSGSTGVLVGQRDVADVQHTLFLGNFSTDGETNWFKKIESEEGMVKSVEQTKDDGYILIGDVKLVEENDQTVPALVKLDEDGEFEWATGLENVPFDFATVTGNAEEGFTWGTSQMHMDAGSFFGTEQTDDGGYMALGGYFASTAQQAETNLQEGEFYLSESSFIGVKLNSEGELQWARTIKIKKYLEDPVMKKTEDGGYILMGNNINYMDYMNSAGTIPLATKIVLVKLDENFNYEWGKIIAGPSSVNGYAITQTSDLGYAITGTWYTGITYELLGSEMEYTEAMILKLDTNGNLGNDNGLITDFSDIEKSDVSAYIVANDLSSPNLIEEYSMDNVSRNIKVSTKDGTNTVASEAITYQAQICTATNPDDFTDSDEPPATKTQAQIEYEATDEIVATSEKGILINDELMPILNEVFNNEVKLWDDTASAWVSYRFSRLVTDGDIEEIVTALEDLGYGIDSNDNGDFTATKIGLTLNFHFYLGDYNAGKLDVMY